MDSMQMAHLAYVMWQQHAAASEQATDRRRRRHRRTRPIGRARRSWHES